MELKEKLKLFASRLGSIPEGAGKQLYLDALDALDVRDVELARVVKECDDARDEVCTLNAQLLDEVRTLNAQLLDEQHALAAATDRIRDLQSDRDAERRALAWQLYRDAITSDGWSNDGPLARHAFESVDAFFDMETEHDDGR